MAISGLSGFANILRSNYGDLITSAVITRGVGAEKLIAENSLLGFLAREGRVRLGADGANPYGDKAAKWPVHSSGGSAASYSESDAFAAATAEVVGTAELDWKRNAVTLEIDELARNAARGNAVVGNGSAYGFEYMAKLKALFKAVDDQMASDGSGNSGKDITGFQAFLSDSNTYAGINQATASYWQAAEINASGASLDEDLIRTALRDMDIKASRPSHLLLGMTQYHKYLSSKQTQVRFVGGANGSSSATFDDVDGVKIVPISTLNDSARANDEAWLINIDDITMHFLPQDADDKGAQTEADNFLGYPIGIKELSTTGDSSKFGIKCYSQLVCKRPFAQGVIYGLSTTI